MEIKARVICRGYAEGEALVSKESISFYGGVDPNTGKVVEKGHPIEGISVKGKVLIFPRGKGSTVGSYTIYRLKKNGNAPCAIINTECDPIVAVGAIISGIPLVDKPKKDVMRIIKNGQWVKVDAVNGIIKIKG
ncbi:MAG: DUF126 domain-containing protein [Candidatus Micrarchaeia archaeon]